MYASYKTFNTCPNQTYWLQMGGLQILQKVIKEDQVICKHFQGIRGLYVVDQSDGDVVGVAKILQFSSKIDVPRYEHHSTGRMVGVGKATQALTKLVICSILGHSTDMDHCYLVNELI